MTRTPRGSLAPSLYHIKVKKTSVKNWLVNNKEIILLSAKNRRLISCCSIESHWWNVKQSAEQGGSHKSMDYNPSELSVPSRVSLMSFVSPLPSFVEYESRCLTVTNHSKGVKSQPQTLCSQTVTLLFQRSWETSPYTLWSLFQAQPSFGLQGFVEDIVSGHYFKANIQNMPLTLCTF